MHMYPEELAAALQLGHAYLERSKLEPAQKIFSGITALDPQNAWAWFGLGLVSLGQRDLERAQQLLQHASQLEPSNHDFRVSLAEVFARRGDRAGALEILEPTLSSLPELDSGVARRARALVGG